MKEITLNLFLTVIFLVLLLVPTAFAGFLFVVESPVSSSLPYKQVLGLTQDGNIQDISESSHSVRIFSVPGETKEYWNIATVKNLQTRQQTYRSSVLRISGEGAKDLLPQLYFSSAYKEITLNPGQEATVSLRIDDQRPNSTKEGSFYTLKYIIFSSEF